ncbi:MAG: hypothetical protein ACREDM_09710 [Methylocella sp.]
MKHRPCFRPVCHKGKLAISRARPSLIDPASRKGVREPENLSHALAGCTVSGAPVTVQAKLTLRISVLPAPWFEPPLSRATLAFLEGGKIW